MSNFTLRQKRVMYNMIEGDRAPVARYASHQTYVNVIGIPLINMLKTVNDCNPASWENH